MGPSQPLHQLHAVEPGHDDVGHQHRYAAGIHDLERLLAVARLEHGKPFVEQYPRCEPPDARLVVDHKNHVHHILAIEGEGWAKCRRPCPVRPGVTAWLTPRAAPRRDPPAWPARPESDWP